MQVQECFFRSIHARKPVKPVLNTIEDGRGPSLLLPAGAAGGAALPTGPLKLPTCLERPAVYAVILNKKSVTKRTDPSAVNFINILIICS